MKISLCQFEPEWESVTGSIQKIKNIESQISNNSDLIIFPEMTLTGFTMHSTKFAEEIDGEGTDYFIDLSRRLKKHIFAGIIENDNSLIYNTLYHFDRDGLIAAKYRKIHPFSMSNEDKYFNAGSDFVVTKIDGIRVGLAICYDLRFPELFRFYAKQKCEIVALIANWPVKRINHWESLLEARAIENQCFIAGVNRIGKDPYHTYSGNSLVINPMGKKMLKLSADQLIDSIEIDTNEVQVIRKELPFLQDIKLI